MHTLKRPQLAALGESPSRTAMVEKLSETALLNIFHYYLDASPRSWPLLVHVCRKWRRIVFASQQALHLRLFCTHGTPVLKTLDCWPALPIVVEYGGSRSRSLGPPAPEDEDNILAALKWSDRIISIHLTVTTSLLEKLASIEEPFSNLEDLVLLYEDSTGSELRLLPSAFRWGPRLRSLHLTGITSPSPALPQLLYFSWDLVDIQLHNMISTLNLPPEVLANTLSRMTQLRSLSLHLHYSDSHPDIGILPSSTRWKRVVFPALTHLKFQGTSGFFNRFIVSIDPPLLRDIEITFHGRLSLVAKLREFIDRIEMQKSHRRAEVLFSEHSISVSFTNPGASMRPKLRISITPSNWQLFSMFELCSRLAAVLSRVEDLHIHATRLSNGQDMNCENWAKLIQLFRGTRQLHIAGNFSTDIVRSLELCRTPHEIPQPSLQKLCIRHPGPRHEPLREAVVSLMVSRRLTGRLLEVEYEQACFQHEAIETLPDDVLLTIFHHCLDASPRSWLELAHVCQGWRQIILNSPLGLDLRLHCTYGIPVLETLECWPPLPLIVNYGGSPMLNPPTPEDEENIMVALKQSHRVVSINLTVTNSLLGKLSAITEPFAELEQLDLLSQDNLQLTLHSVFRWGARLRNLQSTRVVIPTLPQLLSRSTDLIHLQLHEIPNVGYFAPDAFANALSGMTQLETLSLHFISLSPRRTYLGLPPTSGDRVVLPALESFKYRGTSKYLDGFVARIDAPRLADIDITFFNQPTMDTLELGRFINRIEAQRSISRADVAFSQSSISIRFTQPNAPTQIVLRISCKQLGWQLSSTVQILDQSSTFLFKVENLWIDTTDSPSEQDDASVEQWMDLLRAFGAAKDVTIAGEHATDILRALRPAHGTHTTGTTVLPALRNLHIHKHIVMHALSWDLVQSFITSRWFSGRPVRVYPKGYVCHICDTVFTGQQDQLKIHLWKKHYYHIMCSYCSDFNWPRSPNYCTLFQEHLESKHPEVAPTKASVSDIHFLLLTHHVSLRAPGKSSTGTPVTAPLPQYLRTRTPTRFQRVHKIHGNFDV